MSTPTPTSKPYSLKRSLSGSSTTSSTHPTYLLAHRARYENNPSPSGGYILTIHSKPIFNVGTDLPDSEMMSAMNDQAKSIYSQVNHRFLGVLPLTLGTKDTAKLDFLPGTLEKVIEDSYGGGVTRFKSLVPKRGHYSHLNPRTDRSDNSLEDHEFQPSFNQDDSAERSRFVKDYKAYFVGENLVPVKGEDTTA